MEHFSNIVAVMVSVSVEGPYTYRVPHGMTVTRGSIVAVPLGSRLTLGVVWGPPKDNFAHNRLKDIVHAYDCPPLSDELLKLVDWVARYTLAPPGLVLRSVLRSTEALEPERNVTAYRAHRHEPERMTPAPPARPRNRRRRRGLDQDRARRRERHLALGDRRPRARRRARAARDPGAAHRAAARSRVRGPRRSTPSSRPRSTRIRDADTGGFSRRAARRRHRLAARPRSSSRPSPTPCAPAGRR